MERVETLRLPLFVAIRKRYKKFLRRHKLIAEIINYRKNRHLVRKSRMITTIVTRAKSRITGFLYKTPRSFRIFYWKVLKLFPRWIKKPVKYLLFLIAGVILRIAQNGKKILRYFYHRFPYLFHPVMYLQIKTIVLAKRGRVKGVVIYPPTVDWSWMKQRPHQLIEGLSERGYLCFYVNINHKAKTHRRSFKRINKNLYLVGNLHVLYQIKEPIVLVGWTEHFNTISKFKSPKIIYDYLDDLSVSADEVNKEKLDHHKYFLKKSDIVLVTADNLEKDAKNYRKNVVKLPNAGSYDEFHLTAIPEIPKDMKKIVKTRRPIIGYYGALATWFDYELVKSIAKERPNFEFVLIGPDYDDSIHSHKLDKIKNVHWLGIKDYAMLPNYLYYFDVAMIPFVVNEITKSTSPVKIFEYMAGGKITVSTPLDECKKYKSVLIAEGSKEFVKKIEEALSFCKNESTLKLVDSEARDNTWDKRLEILEGKIEEEILKKK